MIKRKYRALYLSDRKRFGDEKFALLRESGLRFMWVLRHCEVSNNPLWLFLLYRMRMKYGLEIGPRVDIGPGFYIGHAFNISINPSVKIGKNVNIHRGAVIGQENRGSRCGTPVIGDNVWIGVNAVIVGEVSVGSDVLIAPNTYVNRDIPSHSIVLGNPCQIISSVNATEGYLNNVI